jgi:hypothetical protein
MCDVGTVHKQKSLHVYNYIPNFLEVMKEWIILTKDDILACLSTLWLNLSFFGTYSANPFT